MVGSANRSSMRKSKLTTTQTESFWVWVNTIILLIVGLAMLYPMLNVLAKSLSHSTPVSQGRVSIYPIDFTLGSWKFITADVLLWRSLANTVYVAVIGTVASLAFTALIAYPLANKNFKLRRIVMFLVVATMIFRYPIIPYFLTIRSLGLVNKINVLIITHLLIAYNLVIMRTFFLGIPEEMEESAYIEGANPFQILVRIILPLSKPVMATLGLFYAVTYWNLFFHPMLFIRSPELFTLQVRLRAFIDASQDEMGMIEGSHDFDGQTIEAATIMFATLPILILYPFLQKYFVKGAMIGSLKG